MAGKNAKRGGEESRGRGRRGRAGKKLARPVDSRRLGGSHGTARSSRSRGGSVPGGGTGKELTRVDPGARGVRQDTAVVGAPDGGGGGCPRGAAAGRREKPARSGAKRAGEGAPVTEARGGPAQGPALAGERAETGGTRGAGREGGLASRLSPRAVILALLLVFFVACALGPTLRNIEANSRLREKEKELKKQVAYTESLEREAEEAGSVNYVEEEARRQLLVAPGEVLYLVTPDGDGSDIRYRVKSLESMEEAWDQVRRVLNCGGAPGGGESP